MTITQTGTRKGSQVPTLHVTENHPSLFDSTPIDVILQRWGIDLLPWQRLVLAECFAVKDDGKTQAYRVLGLSVPRQQGKSEIMIAYILIKIILFGQSVIYTSYTEASALEIYTRVIDRIKDNGQLRQYFKNIPSPGTKQKMKEMRASNPMTGKDLGVVKFTTRGGGGGRGAGFDAVIFDESQDLSEAEYDALGATSVARLAGQHIYAGTPPSLESAATVGNTARRSKHHGRFITETRRNILDGKVASAAWIEWGVDKFTDKYDVDTWYRVMPSLGYIFGEGRGTPEDQILSRAGQASAEGFNAEYLGYWVEQGAARAIDITRWQGFHTDTPQHDDRGRKIVDGRSQIALAVKSDLGERFVNVSMSIRRKDDTVFTELLERIPTQGDPWVGKVMDALEPYLKNNQCVAIYVDGSLAKTAIIQALSDRRQWNPRGSAVRQGKITMVNFNDLSSACANLMTVISEGRVAHSSQEHIINAVTDAKKRESRGSDRWAFESMSGKNDVVPLEATALSMYAVLQHSRAPRSDHSGGDITGNGLKAVRPGEKGSRFGAIKRLG